MLSFAVVFLFWISASVQGQCKSVAGLYQAAAIYTNTACIFENLLTVSKILVGKGVPAWLTSNLSKSKLTRRMCYLVE